MNIIEQLQELGLVAQLSASEKLVNHLGSALRTVYCGFDPTADSLHIGNLVPLLALRRFQLAGHRPLLLVGGATGMIGDPGGRESERELQSAEVVERQLGRIRSQASQFLDFDCGATSAVVVNNADWTKNLSVIDYLRDIGKYFSVNAMIQKESVRRRIEDASQGISYTEFSYMVLQSYDFVVLNRDYDCTIQMGGSDQWGNMTAGIDLVRRMQSKQAYGITYPLVTKSDGTKFGKSSGGAIWLDSEMTSPYSFYQFWINTADSDVMNYLKIFTFFARDELVELSAAHVSDPGDRKAQVMLAQAMTRLVHGDSGLEAAERITDALFSNSLGVLAADDFGQLAQDGMPSSIAKDGAALVDVLVSSGLAVTPKGAVTVGQARKLILGNSISVNGAKQADIDLMLTSETALFERFFIVQKGKKNHHLLVLSS
jgi:tyrosyl-tRNA synthetase